MRSVVMELNEKYGNEPFFMGAYERDGEVLIIIDKAHLNRNSLGVWYSLKQLGFNVEGRRDTILLKKGEISDTDMKAINRAVDSSHRDAWVYKSMDDLMKLWDEEDRIKLKTTDTTIIIRKKGEHAWIVVKGYEESMTIPIENPYVDIKVVENKISFSIENGIERFEVELWKENENAKTMMRWKYETTSIAERSGYRNFNHGLAMSGMRTGDTHFIELNLGTGEIMWNGEEWDRVSDKEEFWDAVNNLIGEIREGVEKEEEMDMEV